MTRRSRAPLPAPSADLPAVTVTEARLDGWNSVITGLGVTGRDKRESVGFTRAAPLSYAQLDDMFHGDDTVARICELVPHECLREWIDLAGDPEGKVTTKLDQLDVRSHLVEAMTWARLYGGSVMILGANDGQDLRAPINDDRVNAFDWLHVLDRHDVDIMQNYQDPSTAKYGRPELYRIRTASVSPGSVIAAGEAIVHESRVIRFDGVATGRRRMIANAGWCDGVVERSYPVVRDFNAAFGGACNLLQDFAQATFKIKGLAAALLADNGSKAILQRLQLLDVARSSMRAIPLDSEGEEFERHATPLTGLPEVLDRICSRLSAATDIPVTLLMGETPGGLNASGDSDHRFFYNKVRSIQETRLRPVLARLIKLAAKAVGARPQNIDDNAQGDFPFTFRPLWQPNQSEIADTRLKAAQADQIYYGLGVLDAGEIAISRFGGDRYSLETTLDTEGREQAEREEAVPDEEIDPRTGKPIATTGEKAQDLALNGAQMEALKGVMVDVAEGKYPKGSGRAFVELSFPGVNLALVDKMLAPIVEGSKKPEPPPVPFGGGAPRNEGPAGSVGGSPPDKPNAPGAPMPAKDR